MHPEEIKAALRMRGYTMAALADQIGLARCTVAQVVNGQRESRPVKEAVSCVLGLPIEKIWPNARPRLKRSREEIEAVRSRKGAVKPVLAREAI